MNNGETVAERLLDLLLEAGIEYFIAAGTGTDFPPIIEAYAKREQLGLPVPAPVTGVHEITAVAMAHGYAMVKEKPVFVMLHTIVGSANGVMGVINARRGRVPMFVASGKTAVTESGLRTSRMIVVHWAQEAFDQQAMFREFVNWAYELKRPEQLPVVIERAMAMAEASPPGPVHVMLPLEVLDSPADDKVMIRSSTGAPAIPAAKELRQAIEWLAGAERPIVITSTLGRYKDAVGELVRFAERLQLPVVEFARSYVNFPQSHRLHAGYDPTEYIGQADVILVIESDVPWIPQLGSPAESARVIVLDEDPLHRDQPYRGFLGDLMLTGHPEATLAVMTSMTHDVEPVARWQLPGPEPRTDLDNLAALSPIDPAWVSHCVAQELGETDILISEFVFESNQACFDRPGSFFDHAHSGGLGWSLGAALGAKLAAPEATVVCCCGDGTYTFGVPVATHHMSAMQDLPVLFIVFNNAAWDRTRRAVRGFAPDGYTANRTDIPLTELSPTPAYEMVCQAAGGYGERVDDPAELPAAVARAFKVVREEGRQALLNVITSKV